MCYDDMGYTLCRCMIHCLHEWIDPLLDFPLGLSD